MHGLDQIKKMNEDPAAHHTTREPQHYGHQTRTSDSDVVNRLLDELLGAVPRTSILEMAEVAATLAKHGIKRPASYAEAKILADVCDLADLSPRKPARHLGMEGILSAIDQQPPFIRFWAKLNDERNARGDDEATYKEAKEAFNGGPTPAGSLAFIGKEFDGLRAVPSKKLVEGGKSYHGEFRETQADESIVWRVVHSQHGPIEYSSPEAAIRGARHGWSTLDRFKKS
jgi:hypothetical protein